MNTNNIDKTELKVWVDEFGNTLREDGKVLSVTGDWVDENPWKSKEIEDAPMDKWFSLDGLLPETIKGYSTKGRYWINKKGEIKSTVFGKVLEKVWGPKDFTQNRGSKKKGYYIFQQRSVHVLYAKLFLYNDDPVNKTCIDHIDGNSFNNSKPNLRWVTVSENNLNKKPTIARNKSYYYAKYDLEGNFIEWLKMSELPIRLLSMLARKRKSAVFGRFRYKDFQYEKHTDLSKGYIETFGNIDYSGWKQSLDFPNIYANPNGCLLLKTFKTVDKPQDLITVGGKQGNYYKLQIGKTSYQSHRLIYCILNNMSINDIKDLEIDHKVGFSNNINNLRLVSHKENMNNEETKKKFGNPVSRIDINTGEVLGTYDSAVEGAKDINLGNTNFILKSIKRVNVVSGGFIWSRKGEERKRYNDFVEYLNSGGEKPNNYWKDKAKRKEAAALCKNRSEYSVKFVAAYRTSRLTPGELDEFFKPKQHK